MAQLKMNVFVRILNSGSTITLDKVTRESTVADIKAMIEAQENVLPLYQQLRFSGNLLDNDSSTMCELNISAESILTLTLRVDSGHEVAARFVGLQTIPQVFEQIVFVKEKNEELYAQIQAIVEVKKLVTMLKLLFVKMVVCRQFKWWKGKPRWPHRQLLISSKWMEI